MTMRRFRFEVYKVDYMYALQKSLPHRCLDGL